MTQMMVPCLIPSLCKYYKYLVDSNMICIDSNDVCTNRLFEGSSKKQKDSFVGEFVGEQLQDFQKVNVVQDEVV